MKRVLTAALVPALAAGLAVAAPATAAHAAPTISAISIKPALAVQTGQNRQVITVEVRASNIEFIQATAEPVRGSGFLWFQLKETSPGSGIWRATDYLYNLDSAGGWNVDVEAMDPEGEDVKVTRAFQVRRATYFAGLNASPEPVRRGGTISVTGQLRGLNTYAEYVPYRGQRVVVYFKKKGTSKWVAYGTATTAKNGTFVKRFKAKYSGSWMAGFAGNGTWYKSYSKSDAVVVR